MLNVARGVAALAAAALVTVGLVAGANAEWWVAFAAGLFLLLLTFVLLLHLHRKLGNAVRSSSRERMRLLTAVQAGLDEVPSRLSTAAAEALADEGAAISSRMLQHLERLEHGVAEMDKRVSRVQDLAARTDARSDGLADAFEALRSRLLRGDGVGREEGTIEGRLAKIDIGLGRLDKALYRLKYEQVKELDAMHQVRERIPLTGRRPTVWGWALSPRALLQLIDLVEDHRPKLVVECGSGLSTIYLATMLRDVDGARVVALEHEVEYANETRRFLAEQGLDDLVEIREAPLRNVEIRESVYSWYDVEQLDGIRDIDFLLIDGPPEGTGPEARYPAVPMLADRLSTDAILLLDDTHRAGEVAIAARWLEEYPLLRSEVSNSPSHSVFRWSANTPG